MPRSALLGSPLLRQLLWRTAAFAAVAIVLLAAFELVLERRTERAGVHLRALHAAELALPTIEHAVWTYDASQATLALDGLLRESAIARARIDTPEPTMRLERLRHGDRAAPVSASFALPLFAPDHREQIGELRLDETFELVDSAVLARAAYRLPFAMLELLAVVAGLTWLQHRRVLAPIRALARQVRELEQPGSARRVSATAPGSPPVHEIDQLAQTVNRYLDQRETTQQAELARQRAEASNAAKSELLSRISHDLRTPLNAIVGFAHSLAADPAVSQDGARSAQVALIERAGRHLGALITDLLDFESLERGNERLRIEAVDAAAVCADAIALVGGEARLAGVSLRGPAPDAAAWVSADPRRLEQVLINLVNNAVKYNRPEGHVEVRVQSYPAGRVRLTVADDGLGMSADQLAALYQPFNRLGREHSRVSGTGLGLFISRRLVERMGGRIEVTSREGLGTEFVVDLPADQGPAHPRRQVDGAGARVLSVLYVEDDPVNVAVMRAVLAARPCVALRVACSIADAASQIRQQRPDLLLLDNQLPDGDGLALLEAVRDGDGHRDLPVILVSGDDSPALRDRAEQAGALAWLVKPVDFLALNARIDQVAWGTAPAPEDGLQPAGRGAQG